MDMLPKLDGMKAMMGNDGTIACTEIAQRDIITPLLDVICYE
jgi:hypothetical protein